MYEIREDYMPRNLTNRRNNRRGGILAAAMLFFVMVTVAGAAILSMSTIQRIKTVRNGIDVRRNRNGAWPVHPDQGCTG